MIIDRENMNFYPVASTGLLFFSRVTKPEQHIKFNRKHFKLNLFPMYPTPTFAVQLKSVKMSNRYAEVLEGAKKVFLKNGIRSVSMDDVCREMGISKKTLYQYFSNKAHLIECLLDDHFEKGKELEKQFREQRLNAIDTLLEVSKMLSSRMKEAYPIVSFEMKKYYPEIYRKHLERTRNATFNHIKENLEQGIREGLYRTDQDIELVASLYISQMENILDQDFYCPKEFSFSNIFEVLFEKHIRGIANEKGIRYFEEKKPFYHF
jgi:TetR/AcrR family transcriptional regulator, cholesterol catabolism regulator